MGFLDSTATAKGILDCKGLWMGKSVVKYCLVDDKGVYTPNSQPPWPPCGRPAQNASKHSVMGKERQAPPLVEEGWAGGLLGKRNHFSSGAAGKLPISRKPHSHAYASNPNELTQ